MVCQTGAGRGRGGVKRLNLREKGGQQPVQTCSADGRAYKFWQGSGQLGGARCEIVEVGRNAVRVMNGRCLSGRGRPDGCLPKNLPPGRAGIAL